jgi:hypothetical protein
MATVADADIRHAILELLSKRSAQSSICPSDAARTLLNEETQWRALMPQVREVARQMAREGIVQITQKHSAIDPDQTIHGPIRIATSNKDNQ